jgi:uncharacterized protein
MKFSPTIPMERRHFPTGKPPEVRVENGAPIISGYAVVWNSMSVEMYGFFEKIAPRAFTRSLSTDPIRRHAFWNHDTRLVLGSQANGSLTLREDDTGLWFEAKPQPTSYANDLALLMKSGDVSKCSFGFCCYAGGADWSEDDQGNCIRTVTEAKLYEVSIVTEPAYLATEANARSAIREFNDYRRGAMGLRARALRLGRRVGVSSR